MYNEIASNWDIIMNKLKEEFSISEASFNTWLKPLSFYDFKDNVIYIMVDYPTMNSNSLGIDIINKKYYGYIKSSFIDFFNKELDIKLVNKSDINNNEETPSNDSDTNIKKSYVHSNLNQKYTFDTFIVGENNSMAQAASLAVAECPGELYNPLFLYGGVGLGKTHLMHSIAHKILEYNTNANVLYVTSEQFTNELVDIIGNKSHKDGEINDFRNKYRNLDCLLIDDIQFIIGKDRTQLEFFHTLNALQDKNSQIVISSDKPPKDFDNLEERLQSRFNMGLTVDIQLPDYETRMAILKNKKNMDNLSINDDVLSFIANNVKSSIRELEGALIRLVAYSRLNKGIEITVEIAERELKDYIVSTSSKEITLDSIKEIVAEHFKISKEDITSTKKSKNIAFPRQIFMYLCRKLTNHSLDEVGEALGGKDHTTILYGCNKIESMLRDNSDPTLTNNVDILIKKISPQ